MKKLYSLFLFSAVIALLATSCDKDDPDTLSVATETLSFTAKSPAVQSVKITTNVSTWKAVLKNTADQEWLTLTTSGNVLLVSLQNNTDVSSARSATIVVTAGGAKPVEINVSQGTGAINEILLIPNTPITYLMWETGKKTVSIASDADSWDAATAAPWIQLSKSGQTLTINVTELNKTAGDRSAQITVTAGNAVPATVTVIQERSVITFNTGEAIYHETNPANFFFDVYDSANPNVGLRVQGFGTLPSGTNDFTLTPGTYSIGTGAGKFVAGTLAGSTLNGTFVYDMTNSKYTLVTGGTFTVALSGMTYTITADLTGVDAISGQAVTGLSYQFIGSLDFIRDYPTGIRKFSDIVSCNYVGKGTPVYLTTPGPAQFMSTILPVTDTSGSYWAIGGWSGQMLAFTVKPENGNIIIDNTYPVAHTSDYSVYGFSQAVAYNAATDEIILIPKQRARLTISPKVLEFTDTYRGLPVFVGIVAVDAATGEFLGVFTELYYNLKLTLSKLGTTATEADPLTFSSGTMSSNTAGSFVSGEKLVLSDGSSLKMFTPAQNVPSPIDRQFKNAARPKMLEPMKIK